MVSFPARLLRVRPLFAILYLLVISLVHSPPSLVSAAVADGNTVFVGCLSSGIKKFAIDGSSTVTSTSSNYGLWISASGGYVYSTGNSALRRVNTDGTGSTTLFNGSGSYPSYLYGVAVDTNYIYFGNDYSKQIGRANLDGTSVNYSWVNLASTLNYAVADMTRANSFLFFHEGGNVNGKRIGRIGIDGTGPTTIATDADAGGGISGVASDYNYVYWVDYKSGEIGRVGQDGTGAIDNFITGLSYPWDLEVTSSNIYVLENGTVVRYNLDGTGKTTVKSTGCDRGIAIEASQFSDVTAPSLSSSTPADGASDVGLASNIVLNFSENVTAVGSKNIVIKNSSDNSIFESIDSTDAKVSVSGSTVTINPADTFAYSTGYYVTIDSGAFKDAANNAYAGISSSTALNFTTVADTTPPTMLSSSPADNATGVGLDTNISFVFSKPVTAVSGKNITLKKTSDNSTVQIFSVTGPYVVISGATVTVNPTSSYLETTGYYLLIDSGSFKDSSNNVYGGISSSTSLNFTSGTDMTDPTIVSTTPADNATGVATAANIVLEFSENITAVSGKDIVIKKALDNSNVESISVTDATRVSISANTVTINPTNPFENEVSYYVLVDAGGFRDLAGNGFAGIATTTMLNFTVVGNVTTSTLNPTNSSSNSSITIAPSVTPSKTQSTTSTVVGGIGRAATSTSSTSTTVAKSFADAAPDAPDAEPGTATAFINGVEVPMTIRRVNNNLRVSSQNLQFEIGIYDESGQIVPLNADGNAVVNEGFQIAYSVRGAQPRAILDAWLFSDPFKLGTVVVGDDGRAEGRLLVSVEVPSGAHRLVMKTLTVSGEEATVAIGVVSRASGSTATVGRVFFVSLLVAISVGLIIPATRRRRRKQSVAA